MGIVVGILVAAMLFWTAPRTATGSVIVASALSELSLIRPAHANRRARRRARRAARRQARRQARSQRRAARAQRRKAKAKKQAAARANRKAKQAKKQAARRDNKRDSRTPAKAAAKPGKSHEDAAQSESGQEAASTSKEEGLRSRRGRRQRGNASVEQDVEVPKTLVGVLKLWAKPEPATAASPDARTRMPRRVRRQRQRKGRTSALPPPAIESAIKPAFRRRSLGQFEQRETLPWSTRKAGRSRRIAARNSAAATVQPVKQASRAQTTAAVPAKPLRKLRRRRRAQHVQFGSSQRTFAEEILVERADESSLEKARAMGYWPVREVSGGKGVSPVTRLRLPPGAGTQTAFKVLSNLFSADTVHFNRKYRPFEAATRTARRGGWQTTIPSRRGARCHESICYGASAIQWSAEMTRCTRGVKIGVIDSGVDRKHPALIGKSIATARLHGDKPAVNDGHGTGIVALLAGDPQSTRPGLAPQASYLAIDIFFKDAKGRPTSDTVSLLKALLQLESWGANVVNLSLVGPVDSMIEETIARMSRKGIIFVAAGGNEGPTAPASYPAAYGDVIAVTAVDRSNRTYRYANRGSYIDVAAPGVDIWTAVSDGKEHLVSGTSLAVPFVTSVVSAMYGSLPARNRKAVVRALRTKDLGRKGPDKIYGRGLVQAPLSCRPIGPSRVARR